MMFFINPFLFFLRVLALIFVFHISFSWSDSSKRMLITNLYEKSERRYWIYLDDISLPCSSVHLKPDFYITAHEDERYKMIPDEIQSLLNVAEVDNQCSVLKSPLNLLKYLQFGNIVFIDRYAPIFIPDIVPGFRGLTFCSQSCSNGSVKILSAQMGYLIGGLENNELVILKGNLPSGNSFCLFEAECINNDEDQEKLIDLRYERRGRRGKLSQNKNLEELSQLRANRVRMRLQGQDKDCGST